ncbi:hypothetical protein ACFQX7_31100 [Luedemannella flava]
MTQRGISTGLAWLTHPVTVVATVVLLLNDHVWKAAQPGFLTGKLSDAAGLLVAPPLVAVVLGDRPSPPAGRVAGVAIAVTGAGFVAVKVSPLVAGWASAVWSVANGPSRVLVDPTDLVALPALGLAWLAWRSAARRLTVAGWARLAAVLVVLPTATLAVAATSAPEYPTAVALAEWDGGVVVGVGNAYHDGERIDRGLISTDGGRLFDSYSLPWPGQTRPMPSTAAQPSWTVLAPPSVPAGRTTGTGADRRPDLPWAGLSDCVATEPTHCFRAVAGHLRVEETTDGGATWHVSWQVTDAARERLATTYERLGDLDTQLSSRALVVVEQPDGFVVLVANGRDGLAHRGPAGVWARIGLGARVYTSTTYHETPPEIPAPASDAVVLAVVPEGSHVVLATAAILFTGLVVAGFRPGGRPGPRGRCSR